MDPVDLVPGVRFLPHGQPEDPDAFLPERYREAVRVVEVRELVTELERLAQLMRGLVSPDPAVRADAERRRRELLARAEAERRPVRERVSATLDEALRRLHE